LIPILEANVRKNKHLASTIAAAMAVAMLSGTSAFAESRHRQETRRGGDARATVRRERSAQPQERQRSDESRNYRRRESSSSTTTEQSRRPSTFRPETTSRESYRRNDSSSRESTRRNDSSSRESYRRNDSSSRDSYRRNDSSSSRDSYRRNDSSRNGSSRNGSSRNDSYRGGDRNRSNGSYGNRSNGSYNNRQPFYHRGAVTRYSRYGNGYRVWIGGAPYPFFVPLSYWRPDRFRIGLVINLGGYYNDSGYYDYYDGYDYRAQSRGDLRGVVESVDYRRGTFVVRNDASGSFVTVIARDREGREVRAGDYVEVSGTWTRAGLFSAYDVDLLESDYRDRY
jgi:hypothetical protein